MASTKALNAKNLETLGAGRLAALLIEVSTGDAGIKRRLRLALAGEASAADAAHEIGKRLAAVARARGLLDWRKVKPLAVDLEAQRRAIVGLVAPRDPHAAFDLLWRLTACAQSVLARTDDGSGLLAAIFRDAVQDFGPVAAAARVAPEPLAERVFDAVHDDDHGVLGDLVAVLGPALGAAGLARLRVLALAWRNEPVIVPPDAERQVIGWGSGGALYADQIDRARHARGASLLLKQIADALGDVDAYVAEHDPAARRVPMIAARIADRLLAAGRVRDAWAAIEGADTGRQGRLPAEWEQARLVVLEALGRHDEAQAFRWDRFAAALDPDHLRAHLKKLPDFDDFAAEQRAIAHARRFPDVHRALQFLVGWPALEPAAALVAERGAAIDGNRYELLSPAADALEAKYPLAATILHRSMIDYTLGKARAARYGHAARHLADCARLARRIDDFGSLPDHDAYVRTLRADHGRKTGFWHAVDGA